MTKHQNFDYRKAVEKISGNGFNVQERYKSLSYDDIVVKQKENTLPFAVCAFNILGCLNTGTIIRSACIFGAEKVILFGRRKYDRRSLVGGDKYIDIEYIDVDIDPSKPLVNIDRTIFLDIMKTNGYHSVFCESPGQDVNTYEWDKDIYGNMRETKPCIVLGNEGYGISPELLELGDVVEIPMYGVMRSLNVGVAGGIVMNTFAAEWKRHNVY